MSARVSAQEMLTALLDALPSELDEIRYRQALCREADQRGYERGWDDGYLQAVADVKRVQQDLRAAMELAGRRHHYDRPARTPEQIRAGARASWAEAERGAA